MSSLRDDSKWYDIRLPRMREVGSGVLEVRPSSPLAIRKAVEKLAYYFKREFGYDFLQFEARNYGPDDDYRAFLWVNETWEGYGDPKGPFSYGFGACCFRWREWKDAPHGWALQWAWFHPYCRNEGHLSDYWPRFRAEFGADFICEPPISRAMRGFLDSKGERAVPEIVGSGDKD